MGIGTILLVFTLLAFVAFVIVSEHVRYKLNRHWLETDPAKRGTPHH